MFTKILILAIILFILIGLYFVYYYFNRPLTGEAPTNGKIGNFQGPSNLPSVQGPTESPPMEQSETKEPITEKTKGFQGPGADNLPSVEGPTGPPPGK